MRILTSLLLFVICTCSNLDNYLANFSSNYSFDANQYPDNASSLSQPNLSELSDPIDEEELGMLEQICNQYKVAAELQQICSQNRQREYGSDDARPPLNQLSSETIITEQNMQHFISISAQNNSLEYFKLPNSTATNQNSF